MALRSTIHKANLAIADIDHQYYADHVLTLARHPSETDQRMMVRLLALVLNAHQVQTLCAGDATLGFGPGLSDPDEPDVWLKDFTGRTRLWIEVGQPQDKPLLKACSKADQVILYCHDHAAEVWWRAMAGKIAHADRLSVFHVSTDAVRELAQLAQRNMELQATVQEGGVLLSDGAATVQIEPVRWK